MKTILATLILSIMLTGCNLFPTKVEIVTVKVPVATVPAPPATIKPKLEIETISLDAHGYDVYVKALESDLIRMNVYTNNLENIINTYKDLSEKLEKSFTEGKIDVNTK